MADKTCTQCRETKPLGAFYLRHKGSEKRRAACKACDLARVRRGPSVISQIIAHTFDPSKPPSAEAEAAMYTTAPLDPALVAAWQARQARQARAAAAAANVKPWWERCR